MHRHVYRLVTQFSSMDKEPEKRGITYEDWACIHEGCTKMRRTMFSSPPSRRVDSSPEASGIKKQTIFGASDA